MAGGRNRMADDRVAETPDRPTAMTDPKVPVLASVPARTLEVRPPLRPQVGGRNKVRPRSRPLKMLDRNISNNGMAATNYTISSTPVTARYPLDDHMTNQERGRSFSTSYDHKDQHQ